MKASLVSATSLAALMALDVSSASAANLFTINQSLGFGDTLVNCAAFAGCQINTITDIATQGSTGGISFNTTLAFAGASAPFAGTAKATTGLNANQTVSNAYTFSPTISSAASVAQTVNVVETQYNKGAKTSQITTLTVTLSGTGVAPVQSTSISKSTLAGNGSTISGNTANLGYVLVNNAPTSAAATITVNNTGNGNSAQYWNGTSFVTEPYSVSNLNGSVSLAAGGGSITGSAGNPSSSVSLNDATYAGAGTATTSANYTYQFTPTVRGAAATSIVTLSFSDGNTNLKNVSQVVTYTLTGTGVAPVASIAGTNVGYVLAGTSKSAVVTVQNTGNGNLSQAGTVSNLFGTVSGASGGGLFSGGGSALSVTGLTDSATQAVSYVFAPTSAIGAVSSTVTGTFSYGTGNAVSLGTQFATVVGTGVAPISSASLSTSGGQGGAVTGSPGPGQSSGAGQQANLGYVLVQGPTAAATVTINNTGNGDLAGKDVDSGGTLYSNLHGVQGTAGSSVFTGGGGTISLQDSNATTGAGFSSNGSTTATFTYNFAPTISNGSAVTATAITTFTNSLGSNGQYATSTYTTTLVGTGVAPIQSLSSSSPGYVLVNAPTVTGSATVTVYNNGNGNLAFGGSSTGAATVSNLQGTVSGLTPPQFGGTGGVLGTSTTGLADSTSQNFTYTFAPTITGQATTTVTAAFANGSTDGRNLNTNATTTIVGTGVAPINSVSTANTISRFNNYGGPNAGTGTAAVTVNNNGNGNLAYGGSSTGAATISNLQGTVGGLTPPFFNGAGGTLGTTTTGLADSTMQSFNYTFSPTARGLNSATVSLNFSNGSSDQTNLPQSVSATLTGTGVGPTYASTYYAQTTDGHTVSGPQNAISTPAPVPYTASTATKQANSSNILFGSLTYLSNKEVLLNISNISSDFNGGNFSLTDLSLLNFHIGGGNDPLAFTIPGNSAFDPSSPYSLDNLLSEGDQVYLPIMVTDNHASGGGLTSYLTITTDEGAAFGAQGDTFTYYLSAQAISTAPEPGSLAVVSVALGGLGFARRRRRKRLQQQQQQQ